jgi:hypothetical protein
METVDSEVYKSLHLLVSPVCLNLFPLAGTKMLVDEILIVACVLSEKFH